MHDIYLYRDSHGRSPVGDYIAGLCARRDKDGRVKHTRILDCINALAANGTRAGSSRVKKLRGEIWELRPQDDRVLFAAWINGSFVLLHQFAKKTQKTPERELAQAERNLANLIEGSGGVYEYPNDGH